MKLSVGYLIAIVSLSGYVFNGACGTSCDGIKPCVPVKLANAKFEKCCDSKKLGACAKHCRYDAGIDELKQAIKNGECELEQVRRFLKCASNDKNNNACCKKTGVLDGNRSVCEPFCNPNSSEYPTSTKGLAKYLRCLKEFNQIMTCHWASCR